MHRAIYSWTTSAVLAFFLILWLATGTVPGRGGPLARVENPGVYWLSIHITGVALIGALISAVMQTFGRHDSD